MEEKWKASNTDLKSGPIDRDAEWPLQLTGQNHKRMTSATTTIPLSWNTYLQRAGFTSCPKYFMRFTRFKRILLGRCKTSMVWNGIVCKGPEISWFWLLLSQWQQIYTFVWGVQTDRSATMQDQRKRAVQDGCWITSKYNRTEVSLEWAASAECCIYILGLENRDVSPHLKQGSPDISHFSQTLANWSMERNPIPNCNVMTLCRSEITSIMLHQDLLIFG